MSLDYETASRHCSYDPETGLVTRLHAAKGHAAGRTINPKGIGRNYVRTVIEGHAIQLHRLAWLLHHRALPTCLLDHINGDRSDNRLVNLRQVTSMQNNWNRGAMSNNTTGTLGVAWCNTKKRFRASIFCAGKATHLGYFRTIEQATDARLKAEKEFFGEFARKRSTSNVA